MHWIEKSENIAIIVDKNRKPETKLKKARRPSKTPKPRNHSFSSVKSEKPNLKIKDVNPQSQNSPGFDELRTENN